MKTPAEIAEANRIKDETADDALLAEFIPVAQIALEEYRGEPLRVPLPGVTSTKDSHFRYAIEFGGEPEIRLPQRFCDLVASHFGPIGWSVKLCPDRFFPKVSGWKGIEFQEKSKVSVRDTLKPDLINEPELPEPLMTVGVWNRFWGTTR